VARVGGLVVLQNTGSRRRCEVVGNWLKSYHVAGFHTDLAEPPFMLERNSGVEFFSEEQRLTLFDHKRNEEILEDLN